MGAANVLIVDDNPTNMKLVSFLLAKKGFDVRSASTSAEALAAVQERVPDLILMDIQLPGTDGLSLVRMLRARADTAEIVIVAVTAYAMKGDEEKALASGCDGYITKPIDTRALPLRLAQYLESCGARGAP